VQAKNLVTEYGIELQTMWLLHSRSGFSFY